MTMKRLCGWVMAAILIGAGIQSHVGAQEASFTWPAITRTAKPWTRWWWLGSAVDKPNLTSSLEAYQKAGLGGVEVTCIYGIQGQDAREIQYLSPQWVEMLKHTAAEAKRLDMGVDLPPGSGWCIGGPQVPIEQANANLVITIKPADAGQAFHLSFAGTRPQALVAYGDGGARVHLEDKIDAKGELTWTPPAGKWNVYTVTQKFSGAMVKRAGPGGQGRSFNPFSKSSLEVALKPFDDLFSNKLPAGAIRSQFHDSFEYQGDWSEDVFDEFQKRCGYDLRDHLPALQGTAPADESARVKADYRKVMSDILLDNIVGKWVEKAHAHGQLARNQAHGSPGNLLDLYAVADIPETEVFLDDQDPLVAKFASSAAHVAGHPLCSSETFTWMSEHFTETLGKMKQEADFLFASGINHIFYHGTAYSPADAAWPGWCFYASSELNPRNSIWHDIGGINAYFARCQSILQEGTPANDVLLYWPASDVWQAPGGGRGGGALLSKLTVHAKNWLADLPFGKVAAQLQAKGYAFDFISDRQLMTASVDDQHRIKVPGGSYRAIIIPPVQFTPPETLKMVLSLAKRSGSVVFIGEMPKDVPGFGDLEKRRATLKAIVEQLQAKDLTENVSSGNDLDALLSHAAGGIQREALVDHPGLIFIRRQTSGGRQYFISNHGQKPVDQWVPIASAAESVVIMDPMLGRIGSGAVNKTADGQTQVYLQLQPGESVILRTLDAKADGPAWNYAKSAGEVAAITGTWQVKFIEGGPELPPPATVDKLASWTTFSEPAQRFAGTAVYSINFDAPAKGDKFVLDLGKVDQSARVRLNGKDLGTLFIAPFRVPVDALKPTGNALEVEVTNVSANRIRDLDRRGVKWRIFKDINLVNQKYGVFDASNWPLADSGLLGPVTLTPVTNLAPVK